MTTIEIDKEMFETFCRLHPIEAFDLDKKQFCDFFITLDPGKSDEEIEKLINDFRE